jgi:hypothetical protein
MYYISQEGQSYPIRHVKKLGDFKGREGSRWCVRKRKKIEFMDFLDVYEMTNGKLKKDPTVSHGGWF